MRALPNCFIKFILFTGLCALPTWAEEVGDGPVPAQNEVVMSPSMSITATTSIGTITIAAGKGLKRSYTWEGATRSVEMDPRAERWNGSLGLYFPGPGEHWKEHNGITRGVVQRDNSDLRLRRKRFNGLSSANNGTPSCIGAMGWW